MTRMAWLLAYTLLAQVTRAEDPAFQCGADASGVRAIRAVATGIVDADNRRDAKKVLAYYTSDAIQMPPNEAPVVGRDRILPRYEALFANFTPEIELQIDEACVGAGLGFVRGRNGGRLVPRTPGEVRVLDDAFVMLLRLEAGGVWRVSHLIWHRQSEAAARPLGE
jgi:uncharacterized protein (TIGR02246 family)